MAERVPAGLRPDAETVWPPADGDPREQAAGAGRDRIHLGVVASHSTLPSAETLPMSGLPPGIRQVATTLRVLKLITEIVPALRFVAYRSFPFRLG